MGLSLSPRQRSPAHSRDPKFQPLRSLIPPQIFNRSSSSVSYEASTTSMISSSLSWPKISPHEIPNHCPEISSRTSPAASTTTTSSIFRSAASRSAIPNSGPTGDLRTVIGGSGSCGSGDRARRHCGCCGGGPTGDLRTVIGDLVGDGGGAPIEDRRCCGCLVGDGGGAPIEDLRRDWGSQGDGGGALIEDLRRD
ncbi:uncharacterized protein A4U43_C07F12890 [Asparagus officinalis]|uniref:Uncharacterized protein n=1 Tax=Asparagus officinalis TaxID=4686 RepID=A0A5P1EBI9_ASPOF|nr:uncharacterized protein A4U43_C07F12890 [Asparagus officinalis]